jgi:hypothetical protein
MNQKYVLVKNFLEQVPSEIVSEEELYFDFCDTLACRRFSRRAFNFFVRVYAKKNPSTGLVLDVGKGRRNLIITLKKLEGKK